jgi:hypothetical protein
MISQGSEAQPSSVIENATRARLTDSRIPPALSHHAVGRGRIALAILAMSLTSCAATNRNAFLGPAYDGPTAAYGYNLP